MITKGTEPSLDNEDLAMTSIVSSSQELFSTWTLMVPALVNTWRSLSWRHLTSFHISAQSILYYISFLLGRDEWERSLMFTARRIMPVSLGHDSSLYSRRIRHNPYQRSPFPLHLHFNPQKMEEEIVSNRL